MTGSCHCHRHRCLLHHCLQLTTSFYTSFTSPLQQRNRELFKVPPYILYVARAFSTLEGIGLSANDDYSIVSEAFPYLSQRLLTDESPRAKAALRSMVYGTSEESAVNEKTPSLSKLVSIGEGFTSYSSATSSAPPTRTPSAAAPAGGARAGHRRRGDGGGGGVGAVRTARRRRRRSSSSICC